MPPPTTLTGYYTNAKTYADNAVTFLQARVTQANADLATAQAALATATSNLAADQQATPPCGSRCPRRRCPPTPRTSSPSCSRT